jgi:hypothetical protein
MYSSSKHACFVRLHDSTSRWYDREDNVGWFVTIYVNQIKKTQVPWILVRFWWLVVPGRNHFEAGYTRSTDVPTCMYVLISLMRYQWRVVLTNILPRRAVTGLEGSNCFKLDSGGPRRFDV